MTFNANDPVFLAAVERVNRLGYTNPLLSAQGNQVECEMFNGAHTIIAKGPTPTLALNRAWQMAMKVQSRRRH
jgi:hypothetical protein